MLTRNFCNRFSYCLAVILTGVVLAAAVAVSAPALAATSGVGADHSKGILLFGDGLANCKTATKGAHPLQQRDPRRRLLQRVDVGKFYQAQSAASAAAATPGSGYFVLSHDTWTGNLGGLAGADAKCLSDLTTYTGWMGYATANSNGQLVAAKVHAFLIDGTYAAKNLMPLATYYFANALDGSKGGASFTTDLALSGPGNASNWSGATFFGASYTYWTDRGNYSGNTLWDTAGYCCGATVMACNNWASASNGYTGLVGISNSTTSTRWNSTTPTCDNSYHLTCFVDPL